MGKSRSARLWIKLCLSGGHVGPGKIELLKQIGERESISAAARAMKMSYRRAWLLVADLNGLFDEPLVATWAGGKSRGGATLTAAGERLIATYDELVERATRANRSILGEIGRRASREKA